MAMEGYLVAGVDVDGVAFDAVLLLLFLLRVKVESGGFAPLSMCVRVRRWFHVNGPLQGLYIHFSLCDCDPGLNAVFAAVFSRS